MKRLFISGDEINFFKSFKANGAKTMQAIIKLNKYEVKDAIRNYIRDNEIEIASDDSFKIKGIVIEDDEIEIEAMFTVQSNI
ncbi:MAG: hypothetical protein ACOC22_03460 [bacterium]